MRLRQSNRTIHSMLTTWTKQLSWSHSLNIKHGVYYFIYLTFLTIHTEAQLSEFKYNFILCWKWRQKMPKVHIKFSRRSSSMIWKVFILYGVLWIFGTPLIVIKIFFICNMLFNVNVLRRSGLSNAKNKIQRKKKSWFKLCASSKWAILTNLHVSFPWNILSCLVLSSFA